MKTARKIITGFLAVSSFFLAAGILLKASMYAAPAVPPAEVRGSVTSSQNIVSDYATLASKLAATINDISPTPAFDNGGWLVKRVVFLEDLSKAYLEYTDTHVALRLLLSYSYRPDSLATKVLATFVPNELGGWTLQYGKDEMRTAPLLPYQFAGDSNQWVPEM